MKNSIYGRFIVVFSMFIVMGLIAFIVGISDGGLLFIIVGLFFAGIGSVALSSIFYRRYVQAKVKKIGIPLYTDPVDVILENTTVNDIPAYRVRTQWMDQKTNTLYYFQSNYLEDDPTNKVKSIEKIKVVVNPSNYSQYYMDLPF